MNYHINQIVGICRAEQYGNADIFVRYLLTDSRSLMHPDSSLFFAIRGLHHDGHDYIEGLYRSGVRAFVITEMPANLYDDAVFLKVEDSIEALQWLASDYRDKFNIPCIAISGSNGKTIVKEWIHQVLSPHLNVVRSPKSYNSQIGVPLSVSLLSDDAEIAVFEAGISRTNEMDKLKNVLKPTLGVFTSLGQAHQENFNGLDEKLREKLRLFENVDELVYPADIEGFEGTFREMYPDFSGQLTGWSFTKNTDVKCASEEILNATRIRLEYSGKSYAFQIPFRDKASIENAVSVFFNIPEGRFA